MSVLDNLKTKYFQGYCYDINKLGHINLLKIAPTSNSVPMNNRPGPLIGGSWRTAWSRVFAGKTFSGKLRVTPLHHLGHRHFNHLHSSVSVPMCVATTMAGIHGHCQLRPRTPSALMEAIHSWIARRTAAMHLHNQAKVAHEGCVLELWMTPSVSDAGWIMFFLLKSVVWFVIWRARNNIRSCIPWKTTISLDILLFFCLERMCNQFD